RRIASKEKSKRTIASLLASNIGGAHCRGRVPLAYEVLNDTGECPFPLFLVSRAVLRLAVASFPGVHFGRKQDDILVSDCGVVGATWQVINLALAVALNSSLWRIRRGGWVREVSYNLTPGYCDSTNSGNGLTETLKTGKCDVALAYVWWGER